MAGIPAVRRWRKWREETVYDGTPLGLAPSDFPGDGDERAICVHPATAIAVQNFTLGFSQDIDFRFTGWSWEDDPGPGTVLWLGNMTQTGATLSADAPAKGISAQNWIGLRTFASSTNFAGATELAGGASSHSALLLLPTLGFPYITLEYTDAALGTTRIASIWRQIRNGDLKRSI